MNYYYGDDNKLLRALNETEFWTRQESEHTSVILLVTPGLEKEYADILNKYGGIFSSAHNDSVKYIESAVRSKDILNDKLKADITDFVGYCSAACIKFIGTLEEMLKESAAVKKNNSSQVVIQHIIRESEYYTGIASLVLYGR